MCNLGLKSFHRGIVLGFRGQCGFGLGLLLGLLTLLVIRAFSGFLRGGFRLLQVEFGCLLRGHGTFLLLIGSLFGGGNLFHRGNRCVHHFAVHGRDGRRLVFCALGTFGPRQVLRLCFVRAGLHQFLVCYFFSVFCVLHHLLHFALLSRVQTTPSCGPVQELTWLNFLGLYSQMQDECEHHLLRQHPGCSKSVGESPQES
mmetsp:Transcript_15536/g.26312  ORF Transcript_15536/g.26312 Transcript_15536/m.26312 type:complete len:200 (+) Transcript_15536:1991-2590(+)